jgi:hypothetical protein
MTSDVDKGRPRGRAVFLSAAQSTEAKTVVSMDVPLFNRTNKREGMDGP